MILSTTSKIDFTSPLAHLLQGKSPVALSQANDSVGLADWSGQTLTHVRCTSLDNVLPDVPKIGDVAVSGNTVLARLRADTVLAIGEMPNLRENVDKSPVVTVTDITHGRGHLLLYGKFAFDVLVKTCALDFSDRAFSNHHVAQTSLAKVNTIIIRNDRDSRPAYHLIVDYSLAEYVWGVVFDAMNEFNGNFIQ